MKWAVGWTGPNLNPWRNLQARPDRAFNAPCLGVGNQRVGWNIGAATSIGTLASEPFSFIALVPMTYAEAITTPAITTAALVSTAYRIGIGRISAHICGALNAAPLAMSIHG
jgi:hypothetical protein